MPGGHAPITGRMTLHSITNDVLNGLETAFPGLIASADPRYLEEPRGLYASVATHVARPTSREQVVALVSAANEHGFGLVPYGGGTGLVGGQVQPTNPVPLLVSLERMNAVRDVSAEDGSLVAEAGAILADIQTAAASVDMIFPLSLASEGSCQIGGNLATNAGGVNVLRYGNTRNLCLGVEAVLGNGTVLSGLKALRKDNTGYDLRHLLIGSEGTLGIITGARLALSPRPVNVASALLTVPSPEAALLMFRQFSASFAESISAFELIDQTGVDFIDATMPDLSTTAVEDGRWHVLVEIGGGSNFSAAALLEEALVLAFEAGTVIGGTVAQSDSQRSDFWAIRESIPHANRKIGAIVSNDISVPVGQVPTFIETAGQVLRRDFADLRINAFGHLGDGNIHYNVFPPPGEHKSGYAQLAAPIRRIVHDLVNELGGSISAEHGIGRAKRNDLKHYGDAGKLSAMAAIKAALDPMGVMNPGAIFE